MSYPQWTFELKLSIKAQDSSGEIIKNRILMWLPAHAVEEFVEGAMDQLDIDHEYTGTNDRDFYHELGGGLLPVSIYKYSREYLEDLRLKIHNAFGQEVITEIIAIETKEWLEGWKESFQPIQTLKFYVYPPWDQSQKPMGKIPLLIEPGMAFGTGQHATTQLVLRRLERLPWSPDEFATKRLIDVGTGTGILALAANKLGFGHAVGTDIDPDAVSAARNNAQMNQIQLNFMQTSTPRGSDIPPDFKPPFDVVLANILFVVLRQIISELSAVTAPGGVLILSGVLESDGDEMIQLALGRELILESKEHSEGWVALTFKKN